MPIKIINSIKNTTEDIRVHLNNFDTTDIDILFSKHPNGSP